MAETDFTPEQLRRRLAYATLFAAVLLTPALWLLGGNLVGDFVAGVWLGTLAAFVMVAGPMLLPDQPMLSRGLVVAAGIIVGGSVLWISPVGNTGDSARTESAAPVIAFGVGAIIAHASWVGQIKRLGRQSGD
ncbi:hypothetical protein H0Z60_10940 [Ectothiorhodospiraceae bacterium WFHF3C12]|nr:hypothetical protein [Ectothiorhodospiraceae bacterium WFHF3C12]